MCVEHTLSRLYHSNYHFRTSSTCPCVSSPKDQRVLFRPFRSNFYQMYLILYFLEPKQSSVPVTLPVHRTISYRASTLVLVKLYDFE